MEPPLILYEVLDHVALLTLNRPEKRNPLSRAMLVQLKEQLDRVAADPNVRAVIIRASGPVFSAGHDLRELVGATEQEHAALFSFCTEVMETIRKLSKPVIAQVHGIATAAGCQLAATCDLVVASEDATFATPGVKIGLFCTTPAVPLSRVVPTKKAMEMLLTGQPITAHEAERIGLVNRVVAAERLAAETIELAQQIITASAYTVGIGKRAFYEQLPLDFPRAYELAQKVIVENSQADDAQEGISAFLEKRKPVWRS